MKKIKKKYIFIILNIFISVLLIFSLFFVFKNDAINKANAQSVNTDWPMFMHDPEHTGSTSDSFAPTIGTTGCQLTNSQDVTPCMQIKWKKSFSDWQNGLSQPVISGGIVVTANMNGNLYAYDLASGNSLWTFNAGSAIAITPAIFNNKVYFGDFNGKIYAINLSNGTQFFSPIQTGGSIYSSPVAVNDNSVNKIFIGSNDGKLYSINADTGSILFTYDTGSYIYSNPAYYSGKVYFASENMFAYAINASTGAVVWSTKLSGESNRGDHPVVISSTGKVLFHSVPKFGGTTWGLKDLTHGYDLSNGISLSTILSDYQTYVNNNSNSKSMYLFNANSGTEDANFTVNGTNLSIIPLNIWYANGQNFPLVYNSELIFGSFGGYVRLDTSTNTFTTITTFQPTRGDEYTASTLSNGWLYGGFAANMTAIKFAGQSNLGGSVKSDNTKFKQLHGCQNCGDPPPYVPFDQSVSTNHWNGITGDGLTNRSGYSLVAGDHLFYVAQGWLYEF